MTNRQHSVGVVQPCRPTVVGFNTPEHNAQDKSAPSIFCSSNYDRSGLMLTDDNLASDLAMLSLNKDSPGPSSSFTHPPSQPSSPPIYAPMSWSPLSPDHVSPYQPINLNIPSSTSFTSRQHFSSPSHSGLSVGASPPRSHLEQQLINPQYHSGDNNGHSSQQQQQQSALTAVSQSEDLGQSNNPNTTPTKDYEIVRVVVYLRGVQRGYAEEGERGSTPTG